MNSWLIGKRVIITGASGGLGFNVAKILIEKYNCKVLGIARNKEKIEKSISTLEVNKENFSYTLFDVSKKENWENFVTYLKANNFMPDIVINNAGFMLPFKKFEKYSLEDAEEIINTNLKSYIYSTYYLLPLIKKSSTPAIVNVASAAGMCPVVGESLYCATKYAVRGFTETLQQDYKKTIYVGGIYPGFIKTDILNRMDNETKQNKLIQKIMMPVEKASKKIIKGIKRRKKRIVMGFDGRSMTFFGRLFPKFTPSLVRKVLKISKLNMFEDVFEYSKANKGDNQ